MQFALMLVYLDLIESWQIFMQNTSNTKALQRRKILHHGKPGRVNVLVPKIIKSLDVLLMFISQKKKERNWVISGEKVYL